MLYPLNIELKIGFDKIKVFIKKECFSELGVAFVGKMRWSSDRTLLAKMLSQTEEFRQLLLRKEPFPGTNFLNLLPQLEKAAVQGSFLLEEEFHRLRLSLQTIVNIIAFFEERSGEYPELSKLSDPLSIDSRIIGAITAKIDENGILKNNASENLQEIRKQLLSEQSRLRRVLDEVLTKAKKQGYTTEDASFTIRDGRMVIPLSAEHKRHIKGFIHDESSSGQTVYLEPAEALDINNGLRELWAKEKREIVKILTALTDFIRPSVLSLKRGYTYLGIIDFIRAKARFALSIDACKPILQEASTLDVINAYHPLLFLAHKSQKKPVIPLTIRLNEETRIVLISGPNAGGKSVTLKTVGLLQYMWQCGMLIPVAEQSRVGIFNSIFIDIGDEQSIENDLSTYSSHLTNMKNFLLHADKRSLCLIDEFGTGTEPAFGGAIAQAILEELNNKGVYGVITTHYSNLKEFAEVSQGIINGAMRFDLEKLEPLYQLEIGKPGSSFALEISKKIGLPDKVISRSKANLGAEQVRMDQLLGELEHEKKKLNDKIRENREKEEYLKKRINRYTELTDYLDENKKKLLKEAKNEAKQLISEANQLIENTIREIKENKADKEKTKKNREALNQLKQELQEPADQEMDDEIDRDELGDDYKIASGPIEKGDYVQVKDQGAVGEVLSIQGTSAVVAMGSLKSKIKLNRLMRLTRKAKRKHFSDQEVRPIVQGIDLIEKKANFSTNLDLRGRRGEESIAILENFLDEASMFGANEVRIIHGKGDGILRQITREKLKQSHQVKSFQDEHVERGGAGVTLVILK